MRVVGGAELVGCVVAGSGLGRGVVEAQHVTIVVVMSTIMNLLVGESRVQVPMVNMVGCDTGLS
jgi:hypothetical protein